MKIKGLLLVDRINKLAAERAPGQLEIQVLGGPEAIPSGDQPIAVRTGTVDMALTCASFYQGLVPVGDIVLLSQVSGDQERKSGALAYIRELHEKAGLFALGRMEAPNQRYLYTSTTKPVQKPEDFRGLRAGSVNVVADAWSQALGMTYQVVPYGDTYTSMESGVIDVYFNAIDTLAALGLEKLKGFSVIDEPVYADNCFAIINLAKWRSLAPNLKQIMLNAQAEIENTAGKLMVDFYAKERKKMVDAGVRFVKFDEANRKKFIDLAYSAQWDKMTKSQPEIANKLRPLLSK